MSSKHGGLLETLESYTRALCERTPSEWCRISEIITRINSGIVTVRDTDCRPKHFYRFVDLFIEYYRIRRLKSILMNKTRMTPLPLPLLSLRRFWLHLAEYSRSKTNRRKSVLATIFYKFLQPFSCSHKLNIKLWIYKKFYLWKIITEIIKKIHLLNSIAD